MRRCLFRVKAGLIAIGFCTDSNVDAGESDDGGAADVVSSWATISVNAVRGGYVGDEALTSCARGVVVLCGAVTGV